MLYASFVPILKPLSHLAQFFQLSYYESSESESESSESESESNTFYFVTSLFWVVLNPYLEWKFFETISITQMPHTLFLW